MRKHILLSMLALVLVSTFCFMLFDRRKVHVYKDFSLYPMRVQPGEPMVLVMYVERSRDCPGIVHRSLKLANGDWYFYDPTLAASGSQVSYDRAATSNDATRPAKVIRTFFAPADREGWRVPRGKTTYHASIDYYCNIVQQILRWSITVDSPPINFEIVD